MKWLPCPFCGSRDVRKYRDVDGGYSVECANPMCGVSTPTIDTASESSEEKLSDIWNRRGGVRAHD